MMNNIINQLVMSLNPQMRSEIDNIQRLINNGYSPEQALQQRLGNHPRFNEAVNIVRSKSPEELNGFFNNVYRSANGNFR